MILHNAAITGSFTVNGTDVSNITGSSAYSASFSTRITNTETTASNLTSASSSFSTRVTSLESASGSFSTRVVNLETTSSVVSGSYAAASASLSTRVTTAESTLNTVSSSYAAASASLSTRVTTAESTLNTVSSSYAPMSASISNRVKIIEDNYATTGSNTLTGTQNISNTTNATGFTTTAALYTAGGLRVTKDAYISSSLYIKGDLTVYGTQSISYITASQLNIANNLISVNTALPSVRFGGLAVYDSGSTALTGSLLWDSQNNSWIYDNPSGSGNYDSAMVIMGPRNASALGNEQGLSCNYLVQGHGHHHTTSSQVYHDGTTTCFPSAVVGGGTACFASTGYFNSTVTLGGGSRLSAITGNGLNLNTSGADRVLIASTGEACFAGNVCVGGEMVVRGNASAYNTHYFTTGASNVAKYIQYNAIGTAINQIAADAVSYFNSGCNVGIGTNSPGYKLDVNASSGDGIQATVNGTVLGLKITQSSATDAAVIRQQTNGHFYDLRAKSDNSYAIQYDGADRMVITSGGCFSIGTTCTLGRLTIASDASTSGITLLNTTAATLGTETQFITWEGLTNGSALHACPLGRIGVVNVNGGTSIGSMVFYTKQYNAGICERMRITSDGNVLLGSPTDYAGILQANGQISVIKSSGYGFIHYTNTTSNNQYFLEQATSGGFLLSVGKNGTCAQPYLALGTVDSENMRIVSGGNVGICTTSPATKLSLNSYTGARLPYINGTNNTFDANGITVGNSNNGNTNIGGGIDFTNNCYCIGAYSPILSFSSISSNYTYNNAYAGIWGVNQGSGVDANWIKGDLVLGSGAGAGITERMRITSTGCIGIGTSSPQAQLQICSPDGQLRLSGDGRAQMILSTYAKAWQFETSCGNGNVSACGIGLVEAGSGTRFQIAPGGVACFSNTVCVPTLLGTTVSTGGLTVPRASLHGYGVNASASTILQTGTQRYSMFGKYIQSYGGTAINVPLFVVCSLANTGLTVKLNIYGVNAVGAINYEDAGYARTYYIGGAYQSSAATITTICNIAGNHAVGTLFWCNVSSSAPILMYSQGNNGYIAESIDIHVTIRDSANIYFCSDLISCG